MLYRPNSRGMNPRRGAAVVEVAIVLPLLVFLFLVAVDYCRLFNASQVVTNCSRNGAIWSSDPYSAVRTLYPNVETAAKADADPAMRGSLTVTSATGTDTSGDYVRVTVSYPFKTLTSYPGLPTQVVITRTVQTRLAPATPD